LTLPIGRFAPTPSGALHFGSLVAALASYCDIRSQQGRWLLRIEDVDTPRVVTGASDQILHDLSAFGFEWDGEILYQSTRFEHYRHYLDQLLQQGDSYACQCSRRSLRKQGVSNGPLGQIYPGLCRDKNLDRKGHSLRMSTAMNTAMTREVHFQDRVYGDFSMNLESEVGDFVLQRSDLVYAYHLAVVVDDELQGVNQIVRGADLLENTCLHLHLQQRLGFSTPAYLHLPLVSNAAGIKLSKQTGATPLDYDKASKLLLAALQHLGQQAPPELGNESPAVILQWSCDHWDPSLITARHSALAQTDDD
jgi:glutamyl-Q tRNA(Asp) synthetase